MMLSMRLTIPVTLVGALLTAPVLPAQQAQAQPDYANAMRHEHAKDTPAPSPAARMAPRAEVESQTVVYGTVGGRQIKGYLTKPKGAKGGPAIIMVHEWWGLNDNIQAVARRYAGEGYTVLAVDLFGRVATTPDSAMVLYQTAMKNVPTGEQNIAAAIGFLKAQGATAIGAVGYCFGGHWSLRTGLVGGNDIKAVVIYYGAPITNPTEIARLKAPVLGLFGGKDTGIPVDSVRAMEKVMKAAGRTVTINVYADANHAFANPTGQAYNAKVADDAWSKSLAFFRAQLK
jgi:carboxymethylenebutenolidase